MNLYDDTWSFKVIKLLFNFILLPLIFRFYYLGFHIEIHCGDYNRFLSFDFFGHYINVISDSNILGLISFRQLHLVFFLFWLGNVLACGVICNFTPIWSFLMNYWSFASWKIVLVAFFCRDAFDCEFFGVRIPFLLVQDPY